MVLKDWLSPKRESFAEMERRLRDEVRAQPPDRPPLTFSPIEETKRDGWLLDLFDGGDDGGSGDGGGGD